VGVDWQAVRQGRAGLKKGRNWQGVAIAVGQAVASADTASNFHFY
jgi:hypothetical protein